jgi:hypothetical protein
VHHEGSRRIFPMARLPEFSEVRFGELRHGEVRITREIRSSTSENAVPANFGEHPIPDVGWICVLLPIQTENRLLFSARLHDGTPEVRFGLAFRT